MEKQTKPKKRKRDNVNTINPSQPPILASPKRQRIRQDLGNSQRNVNNQNNTILNNTKTENNANIQINNPGNNNNNNSSNNNKIPTRIRLKLVKPQRTPSRPGPSVPLQLVLPQKTQINQQPIKVVREIPGHHYDEKTGRYFKNDANYYAALRRKQEEERLQKMAFVNASNLVKDNIISVLSNRAQGSKSPHKVYGAIESLLFSSQQFKHPAFTHTQEGMDDIIDTALHPSSNILLAISRRGKFTAFSTLFSQAAQKLEMRPFLLNDFNTNLTSVRWCPTVKYHFSVTTFGSEQPASVRVFHIDTMECVFSKSFQRTSIWTSEWSNDASFLALGASKMGMLLNIERNQYTKLESSQSDVFSACFDRAGHALFIGSRDGMLRTIDLRRPTDKAALFKLPLGVCDIKLDSDENYLLGASFSSLGKWDRRMGKQVLQYPGHVNEHTMLKIDCDAQSNYLFAGGQDKKFRIWSIKSGCQLASVGPFESTMARFTFRDQWKMDIAHQEAPTSEDCLSRPQHTIFNPTLLCAEGNRLHSFTFNDRIS